MYSFEFDLKWIGYTPQRIVQTFSKADRYR